MAREAATQTPAVPDGEASVEGRILTFRGQRVILDADLAALYGATTSRLNEQVRRNRDRFPADFVLRLTAREKSEVIAICDHLRNLRFSKGLPLAFTEHGAIMAAGVLNTPRAVQMSVFVVRAFVRLRRLLVAHEELAVKVAELERTVGSHDETLRTLVGTIRRLLEPPSASPGKIGFHGVLIDPATPTSVRRSAPRRRQGPGREGCRG
jgi:hypothetical protein